jgi:hypothetical protein
MLLDPFGWAIEPATDFIYAIILLGCSLSKSSTFTRSCIHALIMTTANQANKPEIEETELGQSTNINGMSSTYVTGLPPSPPCDSTE